MAIFLARQDEAADRQLAALMVTVEQIDGQDLTGQERLVQSLAEGIVGLAYRSLPEAGVACSAIAVERSAIRVERCPKRTEENVAAASTSVPAAVAKEAIVGQSTAKSSIIPCILPLRRARQSRG
jgi:hypothetical protein